MRNKKFTKYQIMTRVGTIISIYCLLSLDFVSKLFSKKMEKVKDGTSNQRNVAQSGRHYISRIAPSNHTAVRKVLDGSNSP